MADVRLFLVADLQREIGFGKGGDGVLIGIVGNELVAGAIAQPHAQLASPPLMTVACAAVTMSGDAGLLRSARKTRCHCDAPVEAGRSAHRAHSF